MFGSLISAVDTVATLSILGNPGHFSLLMPYSLAVYVSHVEERCFDTPRL
jgi:hypothetical protein